ADPDQPPVGGDHPVFQFLIGVTRQATPPHLLHQSTIIPMDMSGPEIRFAQPVSDRVTQPVLGTAADVNGPAGDRIAFPDDGVDIVDRDTQGPAITLPTVPR